MLLTVVLLAAGVGCGQKAGETSQKRFLTIATGGTAGTYYPLGGAIAEVLNKNIEGMNATAASTGASVANTNQLKGGDADIAFIQNDIAYYAVNGVEMFNGNKVEGLKALASLYPETCQVVTLKKTGIQSVADLRGKTVAVGAAGSGVEANARQILKAYGLTYDDINVKYLSFAEAASSLKDGNVDAAFLTAGFPTAAVQDISAQHDVVILPVDGDVREKLINDYPFYTKITIPAGTYPKQDKDVESIAVMAMLVTTDKMDENLAYEATKAIFTNLDRLAAAHPIGKEINKQNAQKGLSIPLHPGAEKFFNE
ncbi:MAG: TAXI family TRAP transporter solute-binding subunit [Thermosyntropha sp.]|nr:TAXI family TRAP transporter solute-binding subunit [Thermosyntropha sp.]